MTATARPSTTQSQRLLRDSLRLHTGVTVFLNPFLYRRRFDADTDRWLRQPGQLDEERIRCNRNRFYPELNWNDLDEEERLIKDGAVEMFLKSMELIGNFHPGLDAGQLLQVERKMTVTKKHAFERWIEKAIRRREHDLLSEKRRLRRERLRLAWGEWIVDGTTRQALALFSGLLVLATGFGWWMGSRSSRPLADYSPVERPGWGSPNPARP